QASRPTTPSSSRSITVSGTSASIPTGSCRSTMPARRSKAGDRTTITSALTHRSATSRPSSSPQDLLSPQRPNFPVQAGPDEGRTLFRFAIDVLATSAFLSADGLLGQTPGLRQAGGEDHRQ